MIDQGLYREIPTNLDLNGPILSFTTQPVGVATTSTGAVTLTGIATATFPTTAYNNGSISYQWYEVGAGVLTDGPNIVGSATTVLTISNLVSPTDNNRQFYLQADYVYSNNTGNAINEPLASDISTITVYPLIQILGQPSNKTTSVNTNTTISVNAILSDSSFTQNLTYQWYLNGSAINDGVITSTTPATRVDVTYNNDSSITLPTDATDVVVTVAGASGGGGGSDASGPGGGGGNGRVGRFAYVDGARTLSFNLGRRGNGGGSGNFPAYGGAGSSNIASGGRGGGAGGDGWSGGGGGGGGASGVYDSTVGNYTIVSGAGGGGGGGSWNAGAPGGGTAGGFSSSSGPFSISGGGQGEDKGGDGGGGGGGGGGATGGPGGGAGSDNAYGGGGGNGGGSKYNSNVATYQDQWENSGDGYANLKFTTQTNISGITVTKQVNTTVSGTKSPTLTIKADAVGIQTVQCMISHPTATNSPVISTVSNFAVVSTAQQYNVNVENIGYSNSATISSINLFNGDYEFTTSTSDPNTGRGTNYFSIYSPDKDITVEMDLYGGKGSDVGSYKGGEGGFSRIRFTMNQNVEYVIVGLTTTTNTPFIYRKGSLIACVGGGGSAGTSGNGAAGGGIGISGATGYSRGSGTGGTVYGAGSLPTNGIFGSLTSLTSTSPDTKASIPNAGRVLPCAKGVYWYQQGYAACADIGTTQFRLSDGTVVTNTGSITRGFKSGYDITQTAGAGSNGGGNGGAGATGGNGGLGAGGGGGSGYTDGSVTVVSSILGGSAGDARVILRVVT